MLLKDEHKPMLSPNLLYLYSLVLFLIVDLRERDLERGKARARGRSIIVLGDMHFSSRPET